MSRREKFQKITKYNPLHVCITETAYLQPIEFPVVTPYPPAEAAMYKAQEALLDEAVRALRQAQSLLNRGGSGGDRPANFVVDDLEAELAFLDAAQHVQHVISELRERTGYEILVAAE
jgi:hypothetical protein